MGRLLGAHGFVGQSDGFSRRVNVLGGPSREVAQFGTVTLASAVGDWLLPLSIVEQEPPHQMS